MLEEIEEFLRRAAAKRADVLQPNQAQAPVDVQYIDPNIADVEIVEPEIVHPDPYTGGVAEHVAQHLDTSSHEVRGSQLGKQVGLADEKLESRLHDKFDHRLGALDTDDKMASDEPDYRVPATPSDIARLLGSAENIRNAIILNEILSPPEHRW